MHANSMAYFSSTSSSILSSVARTQHAGDGVYVFMAWRRSKAAPTGGMSQCRVVTAAGSLAVLSTRYSLSQYSVLYTRTVPPRTVQYRYIQVQCFLYFSCILLVYCYLVVVSTCGNPWIKMTHLYHKLYDALKLLCKSIPQHILSVTHTHTPFEFENTDIWIMRYLIASIYRNCTRTATVRTEYSYYSHRIHSKMTKNKLSSFV